MAVDYANWLKTKYPYISDTDIDYIVDKAKMFYYNAIYKAYPTADETTKPIDGFRAQTWIKACCEEIVERNGINSATGYSENGLSIDFDNAEISLQLLSMLAPIAGVITDDSV